MFAVSAVDTRITTVEGLTNPDDSLGPVQQAFAECHGLQCGFCTPGFLTTITAGLEENPSPSEDEARDMVAGNLCRCTGYQNIVKSVLRAAELRSLGLVTGASAPSSTSDGLESGQLDYEERDDDNASTGLGA
jgi:carbon-monoxide dehydrogenase small subunit